MADALHPAAARLAEIARAHMTIETLETRNSDSLDFYDGVAVWSIARARGGL